MAQMNLQIIDFKSPSESSHWQIINDCVMGGLSQSEFEVTSEGYGQFSGHVSLKNNGGFASARRLVSLKGIEKYSHLRLRVKGDGSAYQFRIKSNASDDHFFNYPFKTTGHWQVLEVPLNEMFPIYRGRKLDMSNFSASHIEEIRFMIANQKEEDFEILIDKIELRNDY